MSDSHTDKIDSERSKEIRESMLASAYSSFDDTGNISTGGWNERPPTKPTPAPSADGNEFRRCQRTTASSGGRTDLAAQQIAAYIPDGTYRILAGTIVFDSVSPSELARLICVGAVDREDKLMHGEGPWRKMSEHPALSVARELFGSDLNAALA